jgi:hypothetical protein
VRRLRNDVVGMTSYSSIESRARVLANQMSREAFYPLPEGMFVLRASAGFVKVSAGQDHSQVPSHRIFGISIGSSEIHESVYGHRAVITASRIDSLVVARHP